MTIAVCPGSYDPVTAGHLDVIERCARFFDEVHVVVAVNAAKTPMFPAHTRVDIIRQALDHDGFPDVKVASTTGLITDYCKEIGATVIVKDVARHGGDVTGMVPDGVVPMLDEALSHERGE